MRKIIVLSFITIDGIMQAPGGPDEDRTGGFQYGGWLAPYDDEVAGDIIEKHMQATDLLLGRKTFDIFANFWPQNANEWPGINDVTKYVLSKTVESSNWKNSIFLKSVAEIENLKNSRGSDIKVWGSSELVQLLLAHDLVDELWLKIYPLILGAGKKLFGEGSNPAAFKLVEHTITHKGVIFANYQRDGKVITGTIGA